MRQLSTSYSILTKTERFLPEYLNALTLEIALNGDIIMVLYF